MIQKKKQKSLTTIIGGILDKISYGKIGLIMGSILIICSVYFWLLSPFNQGTTIKDIGFFNSLYFNIITFSSLGYGDISPIGFGRLIASLEVLSGLVLIAVFVGKVASERQNVILRLIYTSEQQRRIVEFEKEMGNLEYKLNVALDDHDHDTLLLLSHSIYRFIASCHNYLKFQSNQGDLASYGNSTSLKRFYKSLAKIQQTSYDAIRTFGIKDRSKNKFEQIIFRSNLIAESMVKFHTDNEVLKSILIEIQNINKSLNRWKELYHNGNAEILYRNVVTPALLERIKAKLPNGP